MKIAQHNAAHFHKYIIDAQTYRPVPYIPHVLLTRMLVDDVTGVLNDLVILLFTQQTLAVVERESVGHLLQLQPGSFPGLLLREHTQYTKLKSIKWILLRIHLL